MNKYTIRQYIELFHLLFLQQFSHKVDKNLYALKGGCNLRFFFNSIRYSEDIDFDVQIMNVNTLQQKVRQILTTRSFQHILIARGINLADISEPKQTATTQRWKLSLNIAGVGMPLHTKIEFSHRKFAADVQFESVNKDIIRDYQLPPIFVNHYSVNAALVQKIVALWQRTQTQARDVFDIKLLLDYGAKVENIPDDLKNVLSDVQERAMTISYNDFKGQVVAYLAPEYQRFYDSSEMWNEMTDTVIEALNNVKNR